MPRVRNVRLDERRLEPTRVQHAHDLSRADRREIGCTVVSALGAERVAEREQCDRCREHRGDDREHDQRGLATLSAQTSGPLPDGALAFRASVAHTARPCSRVCYASTRA
jgi:hypothetical protein